MYKSLKLFTTLAAEERKLKLNLEMVRIEKLISNMDFDFSNKVNQVLYS